MLSEINSIYNFSLQLSKFRLYPNTYFVVSFQRLPGSFFVSKKLLQKINIIKSDIFLHYPLFILSFNSKSDCLVYFKNFVNFINLEYVTLDFLSLSNNCKLMLLFDGNSILKSLCNFLKLYDLFLNLKLSKF